MMWLGVAWDVLCSYLSDLRLVWLRRWYRLRPLPFNLHPMCRPFYSLNSPWAMLDREASVAMAMGAGYRLEDIRMIRPIYGPPVDIYARPWVRE